MSDVDNQRTTSTTHILQSSVHLRDTLSLLSSGIMNTRKSSNNGGSGATGGASSPAAGGGASAVAGGFLRQSLTLFLPEQPNPRRW